MTAPSHRYEIADAVIAGVAATAAAATPGVIRLEPGLRGLVANLVRTARQRWQGVDPVPTDGVRVRVVDGRRRVHVGVVISGADPAAVVGRAVQRAIAQAVPRQTGVPLDEVYVSIIDIELER